MQTSSLSTASALSAGIASNNYRVQIHASSFERVNKLKPACVDQVEDAHKSS
jgi:hypothetical protein